jgi:hypothetical protein
MKTFLDLVQKHEREWGNTLYKGRPDLMTIMDSSVVVFWRLENEQRAVIACYSDLELLEKWFARSLILNSKKERTLLKIFQDRKAMKIGKVKIEFTEEENSSP